MGQALEGLARLARLFGIPSTASGNLDQLVPGVREIGHKDGEFALAFLRERPRRLIRMRGVVFGCVLDGLELARASFRVEEAGRLRGGRQGKPGSENQRCRGNAMDSERHNWDIVVR